MAKKPKTDDAQAAIDSVDALLDALNDQTVVRAPKAAGIHAADQAFESALRRAKEKRVRREDASIQDDDG